MATNPIDNLRASEYLNAINDRLSTSLINIGNEDSDILFPLEQVLAQELDPVVTGPADAAQVAAFNINNILSNTLQSASNNIRTQADLLELSPLASELITQANDNNDNLVTPEEQQTLNEIFDSFENTPLTRDSFNLLFDELEAAGLSPAQLEARDNARFFDPSRIFFGLLNSQGTAAGLTTPAIGSQENSNRNDYVMAVLRVWRAKPVGEDVYSNIINYASRPAVYI